MDIDGKVYYHLYDPTGISLALVDEQGQVTQVAYDAYGDVQVSTLPADLADTLGGMGIINDPATGLTYLGGGRYYDPLLGRPLQPNPSGGVPTVPQSLNRYAATPLGQPGVAEAVRSNGIDPFSPSVLVGLVSNFAQEITESNVVYESGFLILEGSPSAIQKAVANRGLPFALEQYTIAGPLGRFAIRASGWFSRRWQQSLTAKLTVGRATTVGNVGLVEPVEESLFLLGRFGRTVNTAGLRTSYYRGLLLGEAKLTSAALSLGATFIIDSGFEFYGWYTGTGRWGNPYLTTDQKRVQALLLISSDLAVTAGLLVITSNPYIAIPVSILWAIGAEPVIFKNVIPELYQETRNLQPLN